MLPKTTSILPTLSLREIAPKLTVDNADRCFTLPKRRIFPPILSRREIAPKMTIDNADGRFTLPKTEAAGRCKERFAFTIYLSPHINYHHNRIIFTHNHTRNTEKILLLFTKMLHWNRRPLIDGLEKKLRCAVACVANK